MNDDTARLDEANACHDADPQRAALLLRALDPAQLPVDRLPGLAFLLNHVLGEKLGAWRDAHARHAALLDAAGDAPAAVLWRQAAAAAQATGAADDARRLTAALADAAGAAPAAALEVVALTVAMYRVPGLGHAEAAGCVREALDALRDDGAALRESGPLDAAVAACINNIASDLVERPADAFTHAPLRDAMHDAAQLAERFWLRAGNWVHHERAAYLRAMVGNALAQAPQAREHALRALALLDANDLDDNESVDRAFIELEHAHACRALDLIAEADAAQARADEIAAAFGDAFLDDWFASRRRALAMLAAHAG
ncbi:MAG TPA: hypothetical protein PLG77_09465 [Burkholderiaceae bacterium]|nr:hypothetical protein [Burkholderiaceae bacterium]